MASNDVYLRERWGRIIPSDDFFIRRLMGARSGGKFLIGPGLDVCQGDGYRNGNFGISLGLLGLSVVV